MAGFNELRRLVRSPAGDRCEYCGLRQEADPFFRFHVEHVIALQHGGPTVPENLALSCHHCNLHKGPNLSGIDPESGAMVALFNPRLQQWEEHFALRGRTIQGLTETGRATVVVLAMNAPGRRDLRSPSGTDSKS
jgi:hypothetical protein